MPADVLCPTPAHVFIFYDSSMYNMYYVYASSAASLAGALAIAFVGSFLLYGANPREHFL